MFSQFDIVGVWANSLNEMLLSNYYNVEPTIKVKITMQCDSFVYWCLTMYFIISSYIRIY